MTTRYRIIESPIGDIMLVGSDAEDDFTLGGAYLVGQRYERKIEADWVLGGVEFGLAESQFQAYFAGEISEFDVRYKGKGSEFQRSVWSGLAEIPYGTTVSYGELAERVADRTKTRAVAAAVGRNPLSIVVPCHRVIGANGSLTGYAGGLPRKQWLLDHEIRHKGLPAEELFLLSE